MKKIKQAFTLVELIVVVTILAILATIGFVSYSGYLTGVRDTNRVASLTAISDGLELYRTKNDLPLPDSSVEVQVESETIARQGYAGSNVLQTIEYSKAGKDPKDDQYYSYYLTDDKKHYQMMAFLEESDNLETNIFTQTNAATDYSNRHPKVYGKRLGILTDSDNTPIQEITTIKTAGNLNMTGGTSQEYRVYYTDSITLSASGSKLIENTSPLASCKRIKQVTGTSKNGIYTVNPTGTSQYQVFCNMKLEGGGWTLILKADGNKGTFEHTSSVWGSTSALNPTDLSLDKSEFKSGLYATQAFDESLVVLDTNGNENSIILRSSSTSMLNSLTGTKKIINIPKTKWMSMISESSLQPYCNEVGFNVLSVRIGISSNNEDECISNDSRIGIGMKERTEYPYSVGNICKYSCSSGDKGIPSFGYVYIR